MYKISKIDNIKLEYTEYKKIGQKCAKKKFSEILKIISETFKNHEF